MPSSVAAFAFAAALVAARAAAEEPPVPQEPELEEIVVTASRVPLRKGEETSTVTVISSEEISDQRAALAGDALKNVPGVIVNRLGGPGEETSLFMRAGESDHVLVMVDGHQVNADGGGFDWKTVAGGGIERIEALRGTGSALYGSDALVGAVNIITRRPQGPPELTFSLGAGTYGASREEASIGGGANGGSYLLEASRYDQTDYKVPYADCSITALSGGVGAQLAAGMDLSLTVRSEDMSREWGSTAGPPETIAPDPNAWNDKRTELLGAELVRKTNERWTQRLKLSEYRSDELFANDPDPVDDAYTRDLLNFSRVALDWQNDLVLGEGPLGRLDAVLGFEYEKESLDTDSDYVKPSWGADDHNFGSETRASRAGYMQLREEYGRLRLEGNYRHENHDTLGSEDSWRLAAAGIFEETGTTARISGGKAFKEPTIFETNGSMTSSLFGTTVGNPDLAPEGCHGFDLGVEQKLAEGRLRLGSTYFNNRYSDYIVFVFAVPSTFTNSGRAISQGWEHFVEYRPVETLALRLNYTHNNHRATDSDNSSPAFMEGERLIRRPNDMLNLVADWHPTPRVNVFAEWHGMGSRDDVDWSAFSRVRLEGYDRVDFTLSWKATRALRVFARWENIGDVRYEDAFGFEAPGSSVLAGVELSKAF